MEKNGHWLDDDFEKINSLFEEYASSVGFQNVEDFKSGTKIKLTKQVWTTLCKIPSNKNLFENYAADFVIALNNCLKACLKKLSNNDFDCTFSQYIYNTIPEMLISAKHSEENQEKRIVYAKKKMDKIKTVSDMYEDLEKFGVSEHSKIVSKIARALNMSEFDVEKYIQLNKDSKISINQQYKDSEETYDVLSNEAGKKNIFSTPEDDYITKDLLTSVFEALESDWNAIKKKTTETDATFYDRKQSISELLTVRILKNYVIPYERKYDLVSYSTGSVGFDIYEASMKYSFMDKVISENFFKSENRVLPLQTEIGKKYFPDINDDTVSRRITRFISDAVEDLR